MTATPEVDHLVWGPTTVSNTRLSRIAGKQAYLNFVEALKTATGLKNMAIREPADEDEMEPLDDQGSTPA